MTLFFIKIHGEVGQDFGFHCGIPARIVSPPVLRMTIPGEHIDRAAANSSEVNFAWRHLHHLFVDSDSWELAC